MAQDQFHFNVTTKTMQKILESVVTDHIANKKLMIDYLTRIIMKGKIQGATASANHVGFIFSDGSIFHATTDKAGPGVSFQDSIPDMLENPHQYIILDLGGMKISLNKFAKIY